MTSLRGFPARSEATSAICARSSGSAADGVKPKEAAERLRLHPFRAQKLAGQAEGFSDEDLDDAVVLLAALDGALKGQSG